jgi:hypothetical protein
MYEVLFYLIDLVYDLLEFIFNINLGGLNIGMLILFTFLMTFIMKITLSQSDFQGYSYKGFWDKGSPSLNKFKIDSSRTPQRRFIGTLNVNKKAFNRKGR